MKVPKVLRAVVVAAVLMPAVAVESAHAATAGQICENSAAGALRSCIKGLGKRELECIESTDASCPSGDVEVAAAFEKIDEEVGAD